MTFYPRNGIIITNEIYSGKRSFACGVFDRRIVVLSVTRKDIARMAGVSTATVSYVINNSNRVGEKTKERIWEIIEKNDYKPNQVARTMVTNRSMQIAFLVDNLFNTFFSEIVTFFETCAAEKGYFVSICSSEHNMANYIDSFRSRQLDGVFSMVTPQKIDMQLLYKLTENGIPVLVSGNPVADTSKVSLIEPDYVEGMRTILKYLKENGHSKIAYLSEFSPEFKYDTRLGSFVNGYDELFDKDEKIVVTPDELFLDREKNYVALTDKLLAAGKEIDAVVTVCDEMAITCMERLRERGVRVPDDISVVGIDNITFGRHAIVPLTSLGFDKQRFAKDAFEMLYSAMMNGTVESRKTPMFITERKSVKKKKIV